MEIINKTKDKKIVWILLIILVALFVFLLIVRKFNNDGMEQNINAKVYYRTHTNSGWSSWVKNGKTSGNKKTPINGLQIKIKSSINGDIIYECYYEDEWSKQLSSNSKCVSKQSNLTGIKMDLSDELSKSNIVFYRVHNSKYGWMNWDSNFNSVGTDNKKVPINAVEIKIVPTSAYYPDFLRDYNKSNKQSFKF